MSALAMLDATHICSRSSDRFADPAAWLMAPPAAVPATHRAVRADNGSAGYSWWTLLRNPHALLVTGLVTPLAARDAVMRRVNVGRVIRY